MGADTASTVGRATGGGRGSASDGFGQRAATMGSRSSVTYGVFVGSAKSGHAIRRARGSSGTGGFKARNQDRLAFTTARSVLFIHRFLVRAYSTKEAQNTSYMILQTNNKSPATDRVSSQTIPQLAIHHVSARAQRIILGPGLDLSSSILGDT